MINFFVVVTVTDLIYFLDFQPGAVYKKTWPFINKDGVEKSSNDSLHYEKYVRNRLIPFPKPASRSHKDINRDDIFIKRRGSPFMFK